MGSSACVEGASHPVSQGVAEPSCCLVRHLEVQGGLEQLGEIRFRKIHSVASRQAQDFDHERSTRRSNRQAASPRVEPRMNKTEHLARYVPGGFVVERNRTRSRFRIPSRYGLATLWIHGLWHLPKVILADDYR